MSSVIVSGAIIGVIAYFLAKEVSRVTKTGTRNSEISPQPTHNGTGTKEITKDDKVIVNKQSSALNGEEKAKAAIKRAKKGGKGIQSNKKAVVNMDTGRRFESAEAAARCYKCDSSSIIKCCKGRQRQTKGYRWAYETTVKSNKK